MSEYYYSGAVAILTGVLWAVAAFLFTYRGYDNPRRRWDVCTGRLASAGALGVAMFPTAALDSFTRLPWWADWMRFVHYGSAVLLFGCLIFYSLVLFPMSAGPKGSEDPEKKRRNLIYRVCGYGMVGAMMWAIVAGIARGPIFFPESIALMLFGLSWLTKGRALWTVFQRGSDSPQAPSRGVTRRWSLLWLGPACGTSASPSARSPRGRSTPGSWNGAAGLGGYRCAAAWSPTTRRLPPSCETVRPYSPAAPPGDQWPLRSGVRQARVVESRPQEE